MNIKVLIGIIVVLALAGLGWYLFAQRAGDTNQGGTTVLPPITNQANSTVELGLGQSATLKDVTITPVEVVEDSRCPSDVQCIQAGTIRVRVSLESGLGRANQIFVIGEPITTEAEAVTLLKVEPGKVSTTEIRPADYRFTFKVEKREITYLNASADLIRVSQPSPGAVVGKEFKIIGEARGNWYFEASFPIDVLDKDGKKLATVVAQAKGEWMTTAFVPFEATVKVPRSYIGPATIVLNKDNPSGLPQHDASASYRITIEY